MDGFSLAASVSGLRSPSVTMTASRETQKTVFIHSQENLHNSCNVSVPLEQAQTYFVIKKIYIFHVHY